MLDTALGFLVYRPEVHDEFGPGAQGCLHVCGQVFGLIIPAVADRG